MTPWPAKMHKNLDVMRRMGYQPEVKEAPHDAVTFDKIVILRPQGDERRIVGVCFANTQTGDCWKVC
jgi:hypothetical protein